MQARSIVPCERCKESIPFSQYEEHLKLHADRMEESADPESVPLMRGNLVISCEKCGQILQYKKYEEHLKLHDNKQSAVPLPGNIYQF